MSLDLNEDYDKAKGLINSYKSYTDVKSSYNSLIEKKYSQNHPFAVNILSSIASNYSNLGDFKKALEFNLLAVKETELMYGCKNYRYAININNLAINYLNIGDYNKALEYNVLNESFENLKDAYSIHGSKLDIVINYLKSIKKMPMVNFLTKSEVDRSEITRSSSIGECVNSGIDDVSVLDGEILVPYNDYFVSKLIVNSTNILDGGYVKILGIFYLDEIEDSLSFVKLSEISDEKY
jgi:tetratricopeptide (TPR) repeat protein